VNEKKTWVGIYVFTYGEVHSTRLIDMRNKEKKKKTTETFTKALALHFESSETFEDLK
jgi:hypothetical protein